MGGGGSKYENPVFRERRRRRAAEEAERERIRLLQLSYQERINKDDPYLKDPERNVPGPIPKIAGGSGEDYYDAYVVLKDIQDRKEEVRKIREKAYAEIAQLKSIIRKTDPNSPEYSPAITGGSGGSGRAGGTGGSGGSSGSSAIIGKPKRTVDQVTGKIKLTFHTACGDIIKLYNQTHNVVKEYVKGKDTTDLRNIILNMQLSVDELSKRFVAYDTQLTELLNEAEQNLLKITKNNEYIELLHLNDLFKKYYKYGEIEEQNSMLNREIDVLSQTFSADSQKVLYEKRHIEELSVVNLYLFWIYWIFVLIFIAVLVFLNQSDIQIKIGMIAVAVFYPFIIYYIESQLYRLYYYLVDV
jgi:hypothetical protein